MIRVLLADDNPVILQGLRGLLEMSDDILVVGSAADGRQAVTLAGQVAPDVVLLDAQMPLLDGVRAAKTLCQHAKVLMLTYSEAEEIVVGSIRAGASGYLVHGRFDPHELAEAVREVAAGRTVLSPAIAPTVFEALRNQPESTAADPDGSLTRREREVMNLIVKGHSNRAIAEHLYVSEKTVKNHVNNIYGKLGVGSRSEAIALWLGVRRDAQERAW
jgi:DNA-binding NarL/FixJ family response regulator